MASLTSAGCCARPTRTLRTTCTRTRFRWVLCAARAHSGCATAGAARRADGARGARLQGLTQDDDDEEELLEVFDIPAYEEVHPEPPVGPVPCPAAPRSRASLLVAYPRGAAPLNPLRAAAGGRPGGLEPGAVRARSGQGPAEAAAFVREPAHSEASAGVGLW
jgi:hypothetical protein